MPLDANGSLVVVTLEAREVSSGDTARNERRITPPTTYLDLKKPGAKAAKEIIRLFDRAKESLGRYLEELPSEKGGWGTTDGPAGMQLADGVCRVISTTGEAGHPYRLATGILSRLLKMYSSFRLYTHTPCLSIHDNIVHTPRGDIRAKHIVYATNGWTSHLLAPMWEKIVPVSGHMTAQRAGIGVDDGWLVMRSLVLYPSASEDRWDYLTQQPPNHATLVEKPRAEFMFGDMGFPSFDTVGCADDSQVGFRDPGGALVAYSGRAG